MIERLSLELLEIRDVDPKEHSLWATAITPKKLRDRPYRITMEGWELDNFWKNPLFLLNHDSDRIPETLLGRIEKLELNKDRLRFKAVFAVDIAPHARTVYNLYSKGFLRAFSISIIPKEMVPVIEGGKPVHDEDGRQIYDVIRKELLEISAVGIGADPNALKEALCQGCRHGVISNHQKRALWRATRPSFELGAIPPHETDKAPEDTPWDAQGVLTKLKEKYGLEGDRPDWKGFARHFAYYEGAGDRMGDYKFPHHEEDMRVVWAAVANAKARLNQADVSESARAGINAHLKKHYTQFGKPWPESSLVRILDSFEIGLRDLERLGALLNTGGT